MEENSCGLKPVQTHTSELNVSWSSNHVALRETLPRTVEGQRRQGYAIVLTTSFKLDCGCKIVTLESTMWCHPEKLILNN